MQQFGGRFYFPQVEHTVYPLYGQTTKTGTVCPVHRNGMINLNGISSSGSNGNRTEGRIDIYRRRPLKGNELCITLGEGKNGLTAKKRPNRNFIVVNFTWVWEGEENVVLRV